MSEEMLGKYRLLRLLATGGMGEVFLARYEGPAGVQKRVVVKRILRHLAHDPRFVEMFLNEARLAAQLNHPGVVQIFELGHEDDSYFLVMEHVDGHSLRALQVALQSAGKRMPFALVAHVGAQVCRALDYAHSLTDEGGTPLSLVHRDVSPDNVLCAYAGTVKLVDFGIAKAQNATSNTAPGTVKGKYSYMAPEQLRHARSDSRSDLWSTGIMLYELVTGHAPFKGKNILELTQKVLGPLPPPSDLVPDVPSELERIILRALEKDPDKRWARAGELAQALDELSRKLDPSPGPEALSALLLQVLPRREEALTPDGFGTAELGEGTTQRTDSHEPSTTPDSPKARGVRPAPVRAARSSGPWVAAFAASSLLVGALAVTWVRRSTTSEVTEPEPIVEVAADAGAEVAAVEAPVLDAGAPEEVEIAALTPAEVVADAGATIAAVEPVRPSVKRPVAKPGKVVFRIRPWAEVFVDGRRLGVTPIEPATVSAGAHQVRLVNRELKVDRTLKVTVASGQQLELRENLFAK